jgi:transcriptional antiterminator RfaH
MKELVDEALAPRWYAVQCLSAREQYAASALESLLGLTVYLPAVRRRSRGAFQLAAFFPGYLFANADLHAVAPSRIQSVPGVVRLVTFGDRPLPVAAATIEYIREQVREIDARGGLPAHDFRHGDTVRFRAGPFRGLEATFQATLRPSERVRVLLEFLGSPREIELGAEQIERAGPAAARPEAAEPPSRPPRRTRGRGRAIVYR